MQQLFIVKIMWNKSKQCVRKVQSFCHVMPVVYAIITMIHSLSCLMTHQAMKWLGV
jgi:hypothetical protein